jgi:hypothetical protein
MRRTEKGKAYGAITAKAFAVLEALLESFHDARSGLCFPSYEKIADRIGCARSTVAEALKALEQVGVMTWVNRLVRVRAPCVDPSGNAGSRVRVFRTSNGYAFNDKKSTANQGFGSKSDFPSQTIVREPVPPAAPAVLHKIDPSTELGAALLRLQAAIRKDKR